MLVQELGSCGVRDPEARRLVIRSETAADLPTIEAVTISAFQSAPHSRHIEQQIVSSLRQAGKLAISLVAEVEGAVVGHVAISPVALSSGASGWFGLGPISVLPEHQSLGVGTQLVREALRLLRDRGASGCVVLGDPGYYRRFGFQVDPNLALPDVPLEYFQAMSFDASRPAGSVMYDEAFNAHD